MYESSFFRIILFDFLNWLYTHALYMNVCVNCSCFRVVFNLRYVSNIISQSKTGGLVIWRSGSSVVLFRGSTYQLDCVQSYKEEKEVNLDVLHNQGKRVPDSVRLPRKLSKEESMEMSELDNILNELGPRYVDWSGPPPLPVDADALPAVVPGYRTPYRLLPYGVRRGLTDKETTEYRRIARASPPHFALGMSEMILVNNNLQL